jgi:hypothetical protein
MSSLGLAAALMLGRSAHRSAGLVEPAVKLDLALIPSAGWMILGLLAAVLWIFVSLLTLQYGRILAATLSAMKNYPGTTLECRKTGACN